jgi:hypothetical protein
VLWIYSELTKKNYLRKEDTLKTLGISLMSFRRYLKDIRIFLSQYAPGESLKYRRKENVYWLKGNENQ